MSRSNLQLCVSTRVGWSPTLTTCLATCPNCMERLLASCLAIETGRLAHALRDAHASRASARNRSHVSRTCPQAHDREVDARTPHPRARRVRRARSASCEKRAGRPGPTRACALEAGTWDKVSSAGRRGNGRAGRVRNGLRRVQKGVPQRIRDLGDVGEKEPARPQLPSRRTSVSFCEVTSWIGPCYMDSSR